MSSVPTPNHPTPLDLGEAERLAESNGLRALGERPTLRNYLKDVWSRRQFLWSLSLGQSAARFQNNRLGQLWSVLNPALLILSYFFIFGLLLHTRRGVDNFIGFLSIGVVLFGFVSSILTSGAKSITSNLGLIRALRFPRALLPMSVALTEVIANLPAFVLLFILMVVVREPPQWGWLLFPLVIVISSVTLLGIAMMLARAVNATRDIANLIPVMVRLLRYVSGVFFSVDHYASGLGAGAKVLEFQPFALTMTLARECLMQEFHFNWHHWVAAIVWAVFCIVVGLVVFWRDEAQYGRG